jgi:hypothetical protein
MKFSSLWNPLLLLQVLVLAFRINQKGVRGLRTSDHDAAHPGSLLHFRTTPPRLS